MQEEPEEYPFTLVEEIVDCVETLNHILVRLRSIDDSATALLADGRTNCVFTPTVMMTTTKIRRAKNIMACEKLRPEKWILIVDRPCAVAYPNPIAK